ncbi:predicted protein [Chaetoceros tenuissimus]|uniref:Uncharacterized protein n=1 Tax=Chaetoceros tenuissimus TaxID=426638 RepID=A0AAD3CHD1_9STRA|nr:predicted protein [Chaetoceros tenuissimus]
MKLFFTTIITTLFAIAAARSSRSEKADDYLIDYYSLDDVFELSEFSSLVQTENSFVNIPQEIEINYDADHATVPLSLNNWFVMEEKNELVLVWEGSSNDPLATIRMEIEKDSRGDSFVFDGILELEEEDVYFYKKRDKLKVKHVQKAPESSKSSSKKAKGQEIESEESSVVETEIDPEGNLRPSSKMPKSSSTVAPKSSSIKSNESDTHDRKTKRKKKKKFEVEDESKKEKSTIRSSKAPKSLRSSSSSSKAPKSNSEKHNFQGDESSQDEKKSIKSPKGMKDMMTRSKEELVRENLLLREIVNKYRDDVHELTRMQNNDPRVLLDYVIEGVLEGLESELRDLHN